MLFYVFFDSLFVWLKKFFFTITQYKPLHVAIIGGNEDSRVVVFLLFI